MYLGVRAYVRARLCTLACASLVPVSPFPKAFVLAQTHDCMEVFEKALGAEGTNDDYMQIAKYYETKQNASKAGEFYATCKQYHKALKLFLAVRTSVWHSSCCAPL